METSPPAVLNRKPPPPRFRYLIDIIILIAASEGFMRALSQFPEPGDERLVMAFNLLAKIPIFLLAWLLVHLRGESLSHLGLKRPQNWTRTFVTGTALATGIFLLVMILEHAGWRRNLTVFKPLQGNLPLTLAHIFNGIVGAGFYEEFLFRGFLFYGLAMLFGGRRAGWIAAALIQMVVFGAAHGYQGPLGILITGLIGLAMACVYVATGRNLWAPVIAHGLYDAARAVLFYFHGPPSAG